MSSDLPLKLMKKLNAVRAGKDTAAPAQSQDMPTDAPDDDPHAVVRYAVEHQPVVCAQSVGFRYCIKTHRVKKPLSERCVCF